MNSSTYLRVPAPLETLDLKMADGAGISVRRYGVASANLRVFVSHGNGFAIDGYLPFWLPLCARHEVVIFDMRNHGRNSSLVEPNQDYAHLAADLALIHERVNTAFGAKRALGAYHSMSGRAAMKDAVETAWRWEGLVLFDPPDIPPEGHPFYQKMIRFEHRLADWARARPHRFADPGELAAEYSSGRAHANWVSGSHELMARAVLHEDGEGAWNLVYPGELEAQMYLANIPMNLWPKASDFGGPVLLVGADPDGERPSLTATVNKAMADEGDYDYVAIPGTGHMLQLEKPAECLAAMDAFLGKHGLVA